MAENDPQIQEEAVCSLWQRLLEGVLGTCLLIGVGMVVRYYPATQVDDPHKNDLQKQVAQLSHEVQQLQQEQAMPAGDLVRTRATS